MSLELSASGERLMETATEMFYTDGIRATGVDTLVKRAGVSKPTLYAQFGSKEQLVAEVLDRRRQTRHSALTQYLRESPSIGEQRLLAVFDWLTAGHQHPGFAAARSPMPPSNCQIPSIRRARSSRHTRPGCATL